jgi:ABC-2 type transport system ATP-binding protein
LEVSPLNGLSPEIFDAIPGVRKTVHRPRDGRSVLEFILEEESVLAAVMNRLTENQLTVMNLQKREPTLEDVFVELVGVSMSEVENVGA